MSLEWLAEFVHDVPDFPEPGIVFKDISPLLANTDALRYAIDAIADPWVGGEIDAVVGIDARGFIFGAPVAYRLGCGFIPVRKPGKLPRETVGRDYALEYGTNRLEMHANSLQPGNRVVLIDDVLASGGTAAAAVSIIGDLGASVAGTSFLLELEALGGRARLAEAAPGLADPHVLLSS